MRFPVFILVVLLFVSGCTTSRPTPTAAQISQQREELEVLRGEIDLAIRQLQALQQKLASQGVYLTAAQAHDLDYSILAVRQARDKLTAEYRRLHDEYHISNGPY